MGTKKGMCGIFALCTTEKDSSSHPLDSPWEHALPTLKRRGPDAQGIVQVGLLNCQTLRISSSG